MRIETDAQIERRIRVSFEKYPPVDYGTPPTYLKQTKEERILELINIAKTLRDYLNQHIQVNTDL